MEDNTIKTVVAQVSIAALAAFALYLGYDGVIVGAALGSLANLGGFFQGKKST